MAKKTSIQSEKDRQLMVQVIEDGAGSSNSTSDDTESGSDIAPTLERPLSALATTVTIIVQTVLTLNRTNTEKSRAQTEGPRANAI